MLHTNQPGGEAARYVSVLRMCMLIKGGLNSRSGSCDIACLQAAGRRVAYHTFAHVLDLDISFHLERRTGALSRVS